MPRAENTATPALRAMPASVPALRRSLARAFTDDPVALWACPSDALRERVLRRFYRIVLRQALRHDEVWTDANAAGAAIWMPPGHTHYGPLAGLELLGALGFPRLLARVPVVAAGAIKTDLAHPSKPPHWFLAALGVDPDHQGKGLGSRLMTPVLEQCDADNIGAYLESSKEENISFYARHGFRVTRELKLPAGPVIYPMWRDPRE